MESPSHTCPRGGVVLIGQVHPDGGDRWVVSCTACGALGDVDVYRRFQADNMANEHLWGNQ